MAWWWRTEEPTASKGLSSWGFPSHAQASCGSAKGAPVGTKAGPRELMAGWRDDQELGECTVRTPGLSFRRWLVLAERAQRTARSRGCQGRLTGAAGGRNQPGSLEIRGRKELIGRDGEVRKEKRKKKERKGKERGREKEKK